jgi:hypothetical protein
MTTTDDDEDDVSAVDWNVEELHRLDKEINDHEYDANRLRWEYGRHLIDGRGDRQRLPHGILNDLSAATGTSRRELQYRMKFADLFGTEADMCNVLHLPWYEIIRDHLTIRSEDKPEPKTVERPGKAVDGFSVTRWAGC